MKLLFAPWRKTYAKSVDHTKKDNVASHDCVFCIQFAQDKDPEYFILKRFDHNAIILNRYPYNAGHLLIIPFEHKKNLDDLTPAQRAEMMELASHASIILTDKLQAHGFNLGINLGKAGGAGIPSHIHMHVLPRYEGDTNFLPTLSETKQIPFDLSELYHKLKLAFEQLKL